MKSDAYKHLSQLVEETEGLINSAGEYYTEGNKVAMKDLLTHCKKVLAGTYELPFVRSRKFYEPRVDEDILFATRRFSKSPSYKMLEYGLEPALAWFEQEHILNETKHSLVYKKQHALEQGKALLKEDPKTYRLKADQTIEASMKTLRAMDDLVDREVLGKAVVTLMDQIRLVRQSRMLLSEKDPSSNLFYSTEEFEAFRQSLKTDKVLKKEVEKIKSLSATYSDEAIEATGLLMTETTDYEQINQHFRVWSTTAKTVNFLTPKEAASATLKFILPREENEEDGLGHVWIDDVKVYSQSGPDWSIENGGFDLGENGPQGWSASANGGKPECRWEDKAPYNKASVAAPEGVFGHGTKEEAAQAVEGKSIYIKNPTAEDEGVWSYDQHIPVVAKMNNTITFFAKVDGKFKKGLRVLITFFDSEGLEISDFDYYFNKKSSMATGNFNLTVQLDGLLYGITGDLNYARRTKLQLQFILNDFCQGIEHWLICDSRPDDSDAYGAVQGGRILCSIMSAYTFIKEANVFNEEEMVLFIKQLDYFVRNHIDLRDRTELTAYEAQQDAGNWQTDMAAGTGMLMMAMPEFPEARQWLENANMVLRSQLTYKVKADGAWPESIRYHFAALSRFLIYGRVLRNCTGENWFVDGPLVKMFDYVTEMQTPPYVLKDGLISTIPFGDHVIDGGRGFVLAGNYYNEVMNYDLEVASRMLQSWRKAGAIRGLYRGEAVAVENFFTPGLVPEALREMPEMVLKSCNNYPDSGIYTFRKNYATAKESLFAIQGSETMISHGHYDVASFIIFKDCQPIVVDLGIAGYFDSSKDWFISGSSHNVVQFSRKDGKAEAQPYTIHLQVSDYSAQRGWLDGLRTCKVLGCDLSDEVDHVAIELENPEGIGKHIRQVDFYRDAEIYVVTDTIIDFEAPVRFNLNVAASSSLIEGNRVLSTGTLGVDLEVIFLRDLEALQVEKGRTAPQFPEVDGQNVVDVIRAESKGGKGFKTIIYPKKHGEGPLEVEHTVQGYVIRTDQGHEVIIKDK